ncbi:MAG TPA: LuxR C-terminal-related transcriptional regulator [Arachnia sp.]|nr:LuxR C-terminal-related transcriptional regulator [Arachnia sp.]HMT85488.1 LuxR C-terminal-related transcriptional regulator [Arachnia sp.]
MASCDSRFLTVLTEEARAIACGEDSWEARLCTGLDEFFGDSVFLHVVRLTRTGRWAMQVASWVDSPVRLGDERPAHAAAIDDFRRHPGVTAMIERGTTAPVRLSDLLDLPRFRDTPVFLATHSYPVGTRFASAAPLLCTPGELVLLGAHSVAKDFSAEQMERLAQLQRVLSHALTIRTELRRLAEDADARAVPTTRPAPPRAAQIDYWPSNRERQVLGLLILGLTSRQIARRLEITERTVRKHLDSVYRQAHLPGRAAAAAWWQQREPSDPAAAAPLVTAASLVTAGGSPASDRSTFP